jgi:hypothetical protein
VKKNFKITLTTVVLSTALAASAVPAFASDAPAAGTASAVQANSIASYTLTDNLQVEIKSILNEQVKDGTRLGAVIRLKNTGNQLTRVPDYEIRLKTDDGVAYTLQPSTRNARSVNPKSSQELSYMLVIDRSDNVTLSDIEWVDVDEYVYPKKETQVLDVSIAGQSWQGADSKILNASALKKWGEPFTIPSLPSPLVYKTVSLNKDFSGTAPVTVIQVLVENPSSQRQSIPDLAMDGKTDKEVYNGKLVEQGPLTLEPGEKQYIHFAIQTDLDTELTSLNVLTPEKFSSAAGDISYNVGRLNILLPQAGSGSAGSLLDKYKLGTPMKLDAMNKIVHPEMEVSLVELHMQENDGDGFKTAVAKFKLVNNSDRPLPVPVFQTELVSSDGYVYSGSRQAATAQRVLPGGAYAVSYSFALPSSQSADGLRLNVLDAQSIAPYKSVIGSYSVDVQANPLKETELALYPVNVKLTDWSVAGMATAFLTYNYKVKLFLDIQQEKQSLLDANSSKLEIDLVDDLGRVVGSQGNLSFTGPGRLMNGENNILINANAQQLDVRLKIKIYETFVNANGETVKRLLTTLQG